MARHGFRVCFSAALFALGSVCPLLAEVTDVRVTAVTATQALLAYTAPDTQLCTVEASESPSYAPLVNDVDPLLFSGAASDPRPGNISFGRSRIFVIGKRAAEIGIDGRRYSRALQAYTKHYFRITCGDSQAEGSFQTANIPLGKTYGDVLPVDLRHPGDYAWPAISWSDPDPKVVDPLTGILLKPVSRPGVFSNRHENQRFSSALDLSGRGEWTNAAGALAESGRPAEYSGSTRGWLFLRARDFRVYGGVTWRDDDGESLDYVQVQFRGWSPATDRSIEICLTVNGATCASVVRSVVLPAQPPSTPLLAGTVAPGMEYWTDATHPIARPQAVTRSGSVRVDAVGLVTRTGGDLFNPLWTAGSRMTIGSSECVFSAIENGWSVRVDPRICVPALSVPVANAPYLAGNFGVLIRKKTGAGAIYLQSASFHFGTTRAVSWAYGGQTLFCADQLSPDGRDGTRKGYHCDIASDIYWIDPVSGDSRLLGNRAMFGGSVGGDNVSGCRTDAATFRADDPDVFYCVSDASPGGAVVLQARYTGRNQAAASGNMLIQADWTNLTPASQGRSLGALIRQFDPAFDPALFYCGMRGKTAGDELAFTCYRDGQDTVAWMVVFDPQTRKVVAARKSWEPVPTRWCKVHSQVAIIGSDSWMGVTPAYNGDPIPNAGGGPWKSRVTSGATPAAPLHACPPNPFGATASVCSEIDVEGEPCDRDPHASEPKNCPYNPAATYLMSAQPGDVFLFQPGATEFVRLIAKNGNRWTVERGYGWTDPQSHPEGSELRALCSANNYDISAENMFVWNYRADPHGVNRSGATVMVDMTSVDHGAFTRQVVAGSPYWKDCNGCLGIRKANDVPGWVSKPFTTAPLQTPPFAGQAGIAYQNFIESYTSFPPTAAKAPEGDWILHARPLTSDSGLVSLAPMEGPLYKASVPRQLHRRILPTFAMCGMHPLGDVSGPASVIEGRTADAFTYCVAERAGECQDRAHARATAAGEVYVNCPGVGLSMAHPCDGSEDDRGVCIGDNGAHVQAVVQVGMGIRSDSGGESRVLGNFLARYRVGVTYWNARALPDGSWVMIRTPFVNLNRNEVLMAKMPPYPKPDGVNRSDFISLPVRLNAVPGAAAAVVDFGYAENGDPTKFFCTSRQEACVKGGEAGSRYSFAFEAPAPVPCASGCVINIPVIPQRAVYYRPRYFDASGKLLRSGAPAVSLAP